MFKKLFARKESAHSPDEAESNPTPEDILQETIAEQKKEDPLAAVKIGSQELLQRLINGLTNDQGVHVESLLTILGSLAGFSCQGSIREEWVTTGKHTESEVFTIIATEDGHQYYFADAINLPLIENEYSIWNLIVGMAQHLGMETLPDINIIFSHVADTVGGDEFGIPRIPDEHRAGDLPFNYLKIIWQTADEIMEKFCDQPFEKPILLGLAAQEAINMGKDVIDPKLAVQIVMESAIPMSKIDPARILENA